MKKFFTVVLGIAFAASMILNSAAESINQWNYAKDIQLKGESKYKTVTFDQDVYKFALLNLSDIRIVDKKGQFVPYFVQNERTFENSKVVEYSATEVSNIRIKNDTVIDYNVIPNEKGADVAINQFAFKSDRLNFLKNIDILGSYDGIRWENVLSTQIYSIENVEKMKVTLPEVYKYKYYRVKIKNNLEGVRFTGIQATYVSSQVFQEKFIKEDKLDYSIQNQGKNTAIIVKNPNKLRIKGINLNVDGNFKRSYSAGISDGKKITGYLEQGLLYNLKFKDIDVTNTYIDFQPQPVNSDFEIIINNNDDKPLNIKDIKVDYYLDKLVFEGDNTSSYKLYFGNQNAKKPLYDVEAYRNHIENEKQDECTLGNLFVLNNSNTKDVIPDYSKIFNIVIVIISLLLAGLILAKVRSKTKGNTSNPE